MASYTEDTREQALVQLMRLYGDSIKRMCGVYLRDMGMADDAAQETFIKAYDHIDEWLDGEINNEKAWLMRIAINTCRDYRRGAWFRRMDFHQALEELPPGLLALPAEDRSLFLSLAGLPAPEKRLILLYYYHNLTLREAADILGMPKSTAAKRLRRAEEMLRQSLTGGDEP